MKKILSVLCLCVTIFSYGSNDKYRLTLRGNPATSIVVAWNQTSGSSPIVYYGTTDFGTDYTNYPNTKTPDRVVSYKGMNNHFARLTGLQPNTAYYFVIRDSQGTSQRFWFKTAPSDNSRLSFIAGGDSRNNRTPRQNANRLVAKLKPNAVLFGGDMTDDDTNSQWQNWFNDWQLTTAADGRMFPIIAARGNHEGSNNSIYHLFDVPSTSVYYAITFGNNLIRTYTLNTEISISGNQTSWLNNDLSNNSNTIWKMAQYHKPMRPHVSYKSEGNNQYNNWAQLFYTNGVKLVVECDAHTVKSTWPVRPSYDSGSDEGFVRDDQNGTVYVGEGCWGAPLRSNDDNKNWTRNSGRFNQFKWIFVDEQKIETRTIRTDNATQVGSVSNNNPFQIPSNLDVWNPSNGSVVTIYKSNDPDPDPSGTITASISTGGDDVEEDKNGTIYDNSSDLELVYDSYNNSSFQVIGLRFQAINLPKNATITSAYLQFTADESHSTATELEIAMHNSSNSPVFTNSNNVSGRAVFSNKVTWNPSSWSSGQSGSEQRSPNLKNMVQQLANTASWNPGNSVSFIIRGKGASLSNTSAKRVADSYEGGAANAPRLIINYDTGTTSQYALTTAVSGQGTVSGNGSYDAGESASLLATPAAGWEFSGWSGDASGTNNPITLVMNSDKTVTANFTQVPVDEPNTVEVAITQGSDDVEEDKNGNIYSNSSDLELVYDSYNNFSYQVIGLRFRGVAIPQNATITNAYLQFTADESNSAGASLEISLHNSGNSPAFTTSNNVSGRNTFAQRVLWSPSSWSSGQSGSAQRSPDLRTMVQSLVNRSDWSSGNDLSFVIKGSGVSLSNTSAKRVADSYEGGSSRAARLFVTYVVDKSNSPSKPNAIVADKASWVVYPNPFSDAMHIAFTNSDQKSFEVVMYDIHGKVVHRSAFRGKSGSNTLVINPPLVPKGMYLLSITDEGGEIMVTKRIIKQ
ncbi:InlB B-repeat-containing protein [Aquimarina brevivitae]|uniref:Putative repeat protein (TIGR02543 family)/predicted secreted protein (Por secretion system target) n=1 Tax=Aquimarina brevivitae TaxID=323412 RepID=A0A4Q7P3V7_9FLAO|nr:fibronectin type III domain-containing protein [Aquimarina brevivitae]RZS93362.1 putative repeat protein (TIGR02543 family)/predicted secreted protein (Por secretion system target) [Aquimarina brevivitae]